MKIEISKEISDRLKNYEDLFNQTPNDVIKFILDEYENHINVPIYEWNNPPDLSFSHINQCNLDESIASWNNLVKKVVMISSESIKDSDKLIKFLPANIQKGRITRNGFYYIPELDVSVRYNDATTCWKIAAKIAVNYRIKLEVLFKWDQRNILHPNQFGKLKIDAS